MGDDPLPRDFTETQALQRLSPTWSWVRSNVTLPVILSTVAILASVLGGGARLTFQIGQMQEQLAHVIEAVKALEAHDNELAAMQQHLQDMDEQLREDRARWARVDQTLDAEPHKRRR